MAEALPPLEEDPDATWVALERGLGDTAALDEFLRRITPRVRAWLAARVGPALGRRVELEDVLQEVLLHVSRDLARARLQTRAELHAWLFRVCENRIRDLRDREFAQKRDPRRIETAHSGIAAADTTPSAHAAWQDELDRFVGALAALPASYREAFRLVRIEELSYDEAAEVLGISAKNVGVRVVRAKSALHRMLRGA